MSYIHQFLEHSLVQFYLASLRTHAHHPTFTDFNNEHNLFTLTVDLLLFAQRGCGAQWRDTLHSLLCRELLISYETLRNYSAAAHEEREVVRTMRSGMSEVHVQLQQLLLRVMLCYIESAHSSFLNNTILTHISEISLIYPQVKAEISINHPHISLPNFLQKIITTIAKNELNHTFIEVLLKIKEDCCFMGVLERFIDRIVEAHKTDTETQSKKIDFSSIGSDNEEDNLKQNYSVFNDHEVLRKRKKIVFKEFVKAKSDAQNRTPVKQKMVVARCTPKTQKTQECLKPSESKSPHKKTPIFKKIKKPLKKPLERTIYYGQTKKFVPKKPIDPEFYLEKMLTSSSLLNEPATLAYADTGRKTERKPTKSDISDFQANGFCIPETPRPNMDKKSNLVKKTHSMDFFKVNSLNLKA